MQLSTGSLRCHFQGGQLLHLNKNLVILMSGKLIQILCGFFVHSLEGFLARDLAPQHDISISKTTVNSALPRLRNLKDTPAPQIKLRDQ